MEDNQLQQSGKSSPQDAAAATAAITQPGSASKSPAAAAASSGKRKAGSYTTSHPHDPEAAGRELLDKLAYYITQLGGTLDDGWKCNVTMVTIADNGETGTCNAAYICPSGKRYRTRAEVAKFLGLDIPSGKGARMSGHGLNSTLGSAAGLSGRGLDDASHGGTADDHEEDGSSTISKAEAYAAAVKRAEQLNADGIQLPLRLKHNVVVEQLGSVDLRPSFNTPLSIITPGYRAVIEDPAAGKFVSEIKAPAGAKHPQFVVSLEVQQQHLQQLETAATGGTKTLPGLSDSQQQQQQQQQQGQQQHGNSVVRTFELATARNADLAWAQVSSLLERAKMQVEAAASNAGSVGPASPTSAAAPAAAGEQGPHTDAALDPVLAQLLAKAGSNLRGCWGKWIYGLADPEVLQLIEALPNADKTPNYQFVDERGGWDKEREFLSKGRWAKRSTMQVGVRKPSPNKPQQLASKGPEAAAAAASAGKKRPHPAAAVAAAAAATAGSDSALFGPSANKRYRSMDREDRQVAGAVDKVLDKMIRKLEVWWVNETAREAKKAEKAEARQAANEARKAARAAAKEAAEKESGTPDKQHQSYQRSLLPAAVPLQEDLLLSGVSTSPAPAAAAAFRVLKGKQAEQLLQVWEFACCFGPLLGLEQVPSLQQLEAGVLGLVSHTGAMASSLLDRVDPAVDSSSKQQPPSDADELEDVSPAVAAARSAAATALGISQQQIEAEAAAGNCWVQLHTAVLGILIEDVFTAVSSATFDTEHMKAAQLRELRTAMPQVDFTTWPEAARRYLAAAATATYLAQGEPKSSATGTNAKELDMPGHLKSMEVQDWAQYLCGGLNVPDLVSRIALLPQGSSETAAESLLMLDDAAALAAAEEVVQQLAKQQQQQQQGQQQENNHAMDVDGQEASVATPKPDADQQQLLGRRLLQALIKVWGDKSKINSGQRMCFYAQELNPKLGRARGLDLHSVAARLEQGLYQATGNSLEALSADIVLACDLWRDAFNTFDMSREEGFRSADGRLADAVEERMQQLLQAIKDGSDLAGVAGLKQGDQGSTGQAEAGGAQPDRPEAQATGPEGPDEHNQGPESQAGGGQQQPDQQQADVVRMKQEQDGIAAAAAPADAAAPMDIDSPGQQPDQQRQEPEHREHHQQVQAANLQEVKQEDAVKQEGAQLEVAAAAADGEDKAPLHDVQQQDEPLEDNSLGPQEQQDPHGLKDPQRPFNPLYGCRVCWKEDDKARLLLCDGCEDEYHCYCVTPALLEVPEGDWYCPVCAKAPPAGIDDTTAAAAASTAELAQGSSSSSDNVSWDMATSAQLPAVTSSTEPIWERPGMQYIKELVGTAQRLGAVPYGSWPVDARLSLITLLCELLAASHAGRQFVEDRMEQKREAKRRIAEARAKINKAKKEAVEAAKAAAKAARQKAEGGKAEGGGSAAAGGTGDGTAAAQEESVDAAAANAPSSKAGKSSKGKKAAAAAAGKLSRAAVPADEPFDEETELRNIAAQQQLIELTNIRRLCLGQDRFKNTYWLLGTSQLPVVEDASDNAATAEIGTEQQQLQQSVNGPKQQHSGSMGSYGVVMVEPGKMTAAAKQQAEAAAVSLADTAASILASVLPPTAPLPPVVKGDMGPLRMLMDSDDSESSSRAAAQQVLLPALQLHDQQQQAAAAGDAGTAPVAKPWGVYRSVADIDALLTWLNPLGVRESALRSALHKVRDNMVLFAPTVPAAAEQQQQQQQLERDVKGSRAGSPFVSLPLQPPINAAVAAGPEESKHPKLVLKFKMQRRQQGEQQQQQQQQQSTADDASAGGDVNAAPGQASESQLADNSIALHTQQQQHSAAVNPDLLQRVIAAAAAADDAAAAAALRSRFERLLASIPDLSLHEFWGSDSRRDAWFAALAAATRPSDFAALVATLENMVLTDSWRVGFQIWSVPAQHPGLVVTWPQVWYRFLGVEAAKRPGLPTRQQRDRAQELMWRSHAKDKTGQQQQHNKRQRYEAAVGEYDDGLEEDEAVGTSSRRQQQQQQQSLYGSRSGAHGSSSRLTRGRQQQAELFVPRTGRAAAAKAAAAITEQSKGVAAVAGRRSKYLEDDDDFDLEDYSSEPGSGNGSDDPGQQQQQQQDEDAALAAALATQSHYPRRAAAVAATAAMAAASGHQPQQQQRHSRLTRGSAKQAGRAGAAAAAKKPSRQQQQQNAGSGKGSKSRSKQKGGSRRRVQNSDSEEEEYSELSDGDEEVPSEHDVSDDDGVQDAPNEPVSNKQHQKSATDDQKPHITIKGSKAAAEAAAAAERNEHHQQQQRKQDAQSADEGVKQHKRPAGDANDVAAAAAADFGEEAKVLQPPAKKLKVEQQAAAQTTQQKQQQHQQQQHEQTAAQASTAAPGSDAGKTAAAAAGSGKAGATAATVAAAAKTKSGPLKVMIKKPQQPKSKTEALQDLLGLGAAPLSTLSGKRPAAAAAAGSGAAKSSSQTGTAAAAGAKGAAAAAGGADGDGAAGEGSKPGIMSPKKMLLQRHESETMQQLQQLQKVKTQTAGHGAAGGGSGTGKHGGSNTPRASATGHFSMKARLAAEQRAKADPKAAAKEKVAWSDEDDD